MLHSLASRALSIRVESDNALKSLILSMILSEKSATFRDHALIRDHAAAIVAGELRINDDARLDRPSEPHRGEMLAAACIAGLGNHAAPRADLAVEMAAQRRRARFAQAPGA